MKTPKAMYALAKARAISLGPRQYKSFVGYALTRKEIDKMFTLEGFTRKATIDKYVGIWKECELATIYPVGESKEDVCFFSFDESDAADRCVYSELKRAYTGKEEAAPGVLYG